MSSEMETQNRYLNNDITLLIVNVLKFVYDLGRQPSLIDFMNYVRRFKIDTRENLYWAIVQVVEKIELSHAKTLDYHRRLREQNPPKQMGFRSIQDRIKKRKIEINPDERQTKILVHKNPEGVELNPQDHIDMVRATREDPTLMILYAVDVSIEMKKGETFKDMKDRYRVEDKAKWAMYSRDDYVIKTMYSCFLGTTLCAPVLYSKDEFRDVRKYKYIEPFQVWMFVHGKSYRFLFDYLLLRHSDLMYMIHSINSTKGGGKDRLMCQAGSKRCINNCPGSMCLKCKRCTVCKQSKKCKNVAGNGK